MRRSLYIALVILFLIAIVAEKSIMAKRVSNKIQYGAMSSVLWTQQLTWRAYVIVTYFKYCQFPGEEMLRSLHQARLMLTSSESENNIEKVMAFQQDHPTVSITKLQRGGSLNGYSWRVCVRVTKGSDFVFRISVQNPSVYIQKGVSYLLLSTISYRQYWCLIQGYRYEELYFKTLSRKSIKC